MRRFNILTKSAGVCALLCLSLMVGQASADSVLEFDLNVEFSEGTPPVGSGTWLTARFETINVGHVKLTMSASGLSSEECVTDWYFNLHPTDSLGSLTISPSNADALALEATVSTGLDSFKADGDGWYDINFDLPPPPGNGVMFTNDRTAVYDFTLAGIEASWFDYDSVGGDLGAYRSAAHIQKITDEDDSGWIGATATGGIPPVDPIPEPFTMATAFLAIGSLGLYVRKHTRRGMSGNVAS